jgi:hypothetical protein
MDVAHCIMLRLNGETLALCSRQLMAAGSYTVVHATTGVLHCANLFQCLIYLHYRTQPKIFNTSLRSQNIQHALLEVKRTQV